MNTQTFPPVTPRPQMTGFAVTSLVLGIVGTVLSFMPIMNNLTAAGAIVGLVLGLIAVVRSRRWMPVFGIALCGLGFVLTVVAQVQLGREMDEIQDQFDRDMREVEQFESELNDNLNNCMEEYSNWDPADPNSPLPDCS